VEAVRCFQQRSLEPTLESHLRTTHAHTDACMHSRLSFHRCHVTKAVIQKPAMFVLLGIMVLLILMAHNWTMARRRPTVNAEH